jgi:epoxyqueuosine reductase
VSPSEIEIPSASLEELLRGQGFHKVAFVASSSLPPSLSRHPEIAALGRGTFLLAALSCHRAEPEDLSTAGDPHTLIAPFARRNYYGEAVARMKSVVRTLCRDYGMSKRVLRIFCNSPLPEKALAVLSGLGSYGKNTLILIPGLGSLFVIAGLFLPVPVSGIAERTATVPPTAANPEFPLCGSCRACQSACPVHALDEAGRLDESRCLQALCTRPAPFSESQRAAWAFRFYGCQSCQDVCPYNRALSLETETGRGELGPSLSLGRLLSMSVDQIKEFLHGTALARSWIPPRTLLRNALLAAGNRRDPALLEPISRHRASPDPLVSEAAAWAIERIGQAGREAKP